MFRKICVFLLIFPVLCFAEGVEDSVAAAKAQVGKTLLYDPSYVRIDYPGGDVPLIRGVCTDVVIRALRGAGIDLQQLIHEDMKAAFDEYPAIWGLKAPDSNIDHRRVPNIIKYFERQGKNLSLPLKVENVREGDLVAWMLPNGRPHIGIVSSVGEKVLLVHNIGAGAREESVLLDWPVTAHIRPF